MGIFPQFSGWTSKIFELPPLSFGENVSENVTQKLKGFLVTFKLGVPSRLLNRRDVHVGFNFSGDPRSHKKHGKFGHYTTTPQQKPWHLNGGVCQYMSISVKQLNLNWWSECYKIYPPKQKRRSFFMYTREAINWALQQWIKWNMKHAPLARTDAFTSMMEKNMSESNIRRLNNRAPPLDMNNESSHLRIHKSQNISFLFPLGALPFFYFEHLQLNFNDIVLACPWYLVNGLFITPLYVRVCKSHK